MEKTNLIHSPTLDSVIMVEKAIEKYSQECGKYQLWKKLPKKMMYQTYLIILNYLIESGKIIIDKDGCIIWIWNPKTLRRLKGRWFNNKMNREIEVAFVNVQLKQSFMDLEKGKFEDKQLYGFIKRSIDDLKENPFCGIRIPKQIWPKEYILKYGITNLWKYNLPNHWRLTYTIVGNDIKIVSMLLEWFNHKECERRFNY